VGLKPRDSARPTEVEAALSAGSRLCVASQAGSRRPGFPRADRPASLFGDPALFSRTPRGERQAPHPNLIPARGERAGAPGPRESGRRGHAAGVTEAEAAGCSLRLCLDSGRAAMRAPQGCAEVWGRSDKTTAAAGIR